MQVCYQRCYGVWRNATRGAVSIAPALVCHEHPFIYLHKEDQEGCVVFRHLETMVRGGSVDEALRMSCDLWGGTIGGVEWRRVMKGLEDKAS